jgi:NADPH:quinone reductase-like Zn-dependent oxidoreductase
VSSASKSGSGAGSPARWPNSWPCRSPLCTSFPTRWTTCSGRWSSREGMRSARSGVRAYRRANRVLVLGPGTIGLLVALFARAQGAEVHLLGRSDRSLQYARTLGFEGLWGTEGIPDLPFDAVIDASNAPSLPARALELVEPGKRVVYVGLAGSPSLADMRNLVLKDVTAVGILSASPGLAGTIDLSTLRGRSTLGPSWPRRWVWARLGPSWPASARPAPASGRRSMSTPEPDLCACASRNREAQPQPTKPRRTPHE